MNETIVKPASNKVIHQVRPSSAWRNWIGMLPFLLFILVFLILPSTNLFIGAFQDQQGHFTLANVGVFLNDYVLKSYLISLEVSLITSVLGGVMGFFIAYAITLGKAPAWMRNIILSFSGLAANFGGVPSSPPWVIPVFLPLFLKVSVSLQPPEHRLVHSISIRPGLTYTASPALH